MNFFDGDDDMALARDQGRRLGDVVDGLDGIPENGMFNEYHDPMHDLAAVTAAVANEDLVLPMDANGLDDDGLSHLVDDMTEKDFKDLTADMEQDLIQPTPVVQNLTTTTEAQDKDLERYLEQHPYLKIYVKNMNPELATSLGLPKFVIFYPKFFQEVRKEQERQAHLYKNAAQMRDMQLGNDKNNFFFVALKPPNMSEWKRTIGGEELEARKRESDARKERRRLEAAEHRAARPRRAVAAMNALPDDEIFPDGLRPDHADDASATMAALLGGEEDDDDVATERTTERTTKKSKKPQVKTAQKRKASAMEVADNREQDRQDNQSHWWMGTVPQSAMLKHPDDPDHPLLYAELPKVLRDPTLGGFDIALDQMKKPGTIDVLTKEQEYQYVGRYRAGTKKDQFNGWQTQVSFPNRGVVYLSLTWEARLGALAAMVAKIDPRLRNKESVHAWMQRMVRADGDASARIWLDEMEDNIRNTDTRVKAGGGRKRSEGGLPDDLKLLHSGYMHPTLEARPPPPEATDEELAALAERVGSVTSMDRSFPPPPAPPAPPAPPPPPPPPPAAIPPVADPIALPPLDLGATDAPVDMDPYTLLPDLGFSVQYLTDEEARNVLRDSHNGETTHSAAQDLREQNATARQLREVLGFDDDVLVNVYTPEELSLSGFSASDLLQRGISIQEVRKAYGAEEVRLAGY